MRHGLKYCLMVLLTLVFSMGYAQRTKESLEKEIKSLQKEIETANKLACRCGFSSLVPPG